MSDVVTTRLTDSAVFVITIDRPQRRNALDDAVWTGIRDGAQSAVASGAGAVVLTGAHGVFCAGGDLKSFDHGDDAAGVFDSAARLRLGHAVLRELHHLPLPVIAAVDGPAIGVGWSLALACDLIVASESSYFSAPFVRRGLVPDGGLGWHLTQRLGLHAAAALLLLAQERVSARTAAQHGLVNEVVPAGDAAQRAEVIAQTFAEGARDTIAQTRMLLRQAIATTFEAYLHGELQAFALNNRTGNPSEGIAAYLESREPVFGAPTRSAR